jgi:amino acid adenylation domain-containing protein
MKAPELLAALSDLNVQLWVEGDQLRYRAPKGALISELRDLLLRDKEEVMGLLRQRARESISSYPLSYAQKALWFLNQAAPGSTTYNVAFSFRIHSDLNTPALKGVVQALMDRHPMLRTTYSDDNGVPVQHIHGYMQADFNEIDASRWNEEEMREKVIETYKRPFDLERGPLFRVFLFNRSERDHVLLMVAYHIAIDGWSMRLLLDEMRATYSSRTSGNSSSIPLPELNYTDYTQWQTEMIAGPEGERLRTYWEKQLEGELTTLNLPGRRLRMIYPERRGASHLFTLNKSLTAQINSLARAEGVTVYTMLLTLYAVLLHRYTGEEDILIISPVAGRNKPEYTRIVGCFANLIVLRIRINGGMTFRQLLGQTRSTVLGALDHQNYPLELLTAGLLPTVDLSRFGFALQRPQEPGDFSTVLGTGVEVPRINFGGIEVEPYHIPQGEGQVDLGLDMADDGRGLLWGTLKYDANLFDPYAISQMGNHFKTLFESVASDLTLRLSELSLMPEAERHQILIDWNNTEANYPKEKSVGRLFEEKAACNPDSIALMCAGESLSYGELNRRANLVANHLLELGAQPDDIIGMYTDRSMNMVVGLLGILKAGSAYTPLDPNFPEDRIKFMIQDSDSKILITQRHLKENISDFSGQMICIDSDWGKISNGNASNPTMDSGPDNLAYVIYTSGSTGTPKGVQIPNRALVNFLYSMRREPGLSEEDAVLSVTTMSFDIFGLELFLPLLFGARVIIAERDDTLDGLRLADLIKEHNVSIMQATPSTWRLLIDSGWPGHDPLKAICGGEAFPPDLVDPMLRRCKEVWNLYGPTETTIWSTAFRVTSGKGPVLIGRPIANTQTYILDDLLQPVPIGLVGELHIGGDGLSPGYLNRPELTAEKFVPHPFNKEPGKRIYKTGDLARYRSDGMIECLGRIDHQVKLRGFRIELGEIESRLKEIEGVSDSVVVLREDRPGDQRLVSYYVVKKGGEASASDLRNYLRTKLPDYMVPQHFVKLDSMPLTPNGKVDRKALPKPELGVAPGKEYVAPRTETERTIAMVWKEVLGQERVGVHDDFFELGGHSLLATQVISRIEGALNIELSLRSLFESPTVAGLAETIARSQIEQADGKTLAQLLAEVEQLSPDEVKTLLAFDRRQEETQHD